MPAEQLEGDFWKYNLGSEEKAKPILADCLGLF